MPPDQIRWYTLEVDMKLKKRYMETKKVVIVKVEDLFDFGALHKVLEKSLNLFKAYDHITVPEDLLTYKLFSTTLSLRNNILKKIRDAKPKPNAEKAKELNELFEQGQMIVICHHMPTQLALLLLEDSGIKFEYICHEEQKEDMKKLTFMPDDAEYVEYSKKEEEVVVVKKTTKSKAKTKKVTPKIEVKPELEVKPEPEVKEPDPEVVKTESED